MCVRGVVLAPRRFYLICSNKIQHISSSLCILVQDLHFFGDLWNRSLGSGQRRRDIAPFRVCLYMLRSLLKRSVCCSDCWIHFRAVLIKILCHRDASSTRVWRCICQRSSPFFWKDVWFLRASWRALLIWLKFHEESSGNSNSFWVSIRAGDILKFETKSLRRLQ